MNQLIYSKNVCPQCRFECSTKTIIKLYMSHDCIVSSESNKVLPKPENSDEKTVKLQMLLNDTV